MLFAQGRVFPFFCLLAICGVVLFQIERAKKGMPVVVRKIPALDAIGEGIGRATEMGRPVHFSSGCIGMSSASYAPIVMASMEYLAFVARQCARFDTQLIVTVAAGDNYAVSEEVVRNAYAHEGVLEHLKPGTVRFLGTGFVFASSVCNILEQEKVATNIMIGGWADESLFVAEGGHLAGALGIGGTTNQYQIPFFVAACDSVLLADELFVGSAYLSQDPVELGVVAGQDWGKALGLFLLVTGIVLKTLDVNLLVNIMSR